MIRSTDPHPTRRQAVIGVAGVAMSVICALGAPGTVAAHPETGGLTPAVATAYDQASKAAAVEGVPLWITSGRRSEEQQRQLWRDAVVRHGSPEVARRWVLPAEESPHVRGDAVDVGPIAGAAWLERNGHRWGLCRTFANEWWHFELATVPGLPCPPMWPDAATREDRRPR